MPRKRVSCWGRAARTATSARRRSSGVSARRPSSPASLILDSVFALPPQDIIRRSRGKPRVSRAETTELPRWPKPATPIVFPSSSPAAGSIFDSIAVSFITISSFQAIKHMQQRTASLWQAKPTVLHAHRRGSVTTNSVIQLLKKMGYSGRRGPLAITGRYTVGARLLLRGPPSEYDCKS